MASRKLAVVPMIVSMFFFAGASYFSFVYPADSFTLFTSTIIAILCIAGIGFTATGIRIALSR